MRKLLQATLLALALTPGPLVRAQATIPAAEPANFFSGTVVTCTATMLKVNRKTLTRDTVTKTFAIDENTKVEGVLKPKVQVTVRFVVEDAAARAIHIIVR